MEPEITHECADDEVSETRGESFSKGDIFYAMIPTWNQEDLLLPEMRRRPNIHSIVQGIVSEISGDYILSRHPKAEHDPRFEDHQTKAYHLRYCYKDESMAQYAADRLNDLENTEIE